MVVIARYMNVRCIVDFSGLIAKAIPDRQTFSVQIVGSFNLRCTGGSPPLKVWVKIPANLLERGSRGMGHFHGLVRKEDGDEEHPKSMALIKRGIRSNPGPGI
jgi:hypothetical protein